MAHQYIEQLDDKVRAAVFGNVGTIVCFRIGAEDAELVEKEFEPEFNANDLVNLSKHNIYVKLMIDGISSHPFSAETLPPRPVPENTPIDAIIENNRRRYGTPKEAVEQKIKEESLGGRQEVMDKAERRTEQPLEILEGPKKDRKQVNLDELREVLSKSVKKELKEEDNK